MELDQAPLPWRNKAVEVNTCTANPGVGEDTSYCICTARLHFFGEQGALGVSSSLVTLYKFVDPFAIGVRGHKGVTPG